jgi:hypothetical protein
MINPFKVRKANDVPAWMWFVLPVPSIILMTIGWFVPGLPGALIMVPGLALAITFYAWVVRLKH